MNGNTSFFRKLSADTKVKRETPPIPENVSSEQAAQVIQLWWRQVQLRETAKESSHYLNDVVSLQQATDKSFSKLEEFILDKDNQGITRDLLIHLEQAKDLILPERNRTPELKQQEQVFLSAYLIATKSEHLFGPASDIDAHLEHQAIAMLKSFEELCRFMGETYMEKVSNRIDSPMARATPSSDHVFANIEQVPLNRSRERMQKDQRFMIEGIPYLESFHRAQMSYYETFNTWESDNRNRLAKICIEKYVQLESKRIVIFNSPDPMQWELYEGYGSQQETLRKKIEFLCGEEGLNGLNRELESVREALRANKWASLPLEVLAHELALNPGFNYPNERNPIQPKVSIEAALTALGEEPYSIELMLDVLEEVIHHLASLTPHNERRVHALKSELGREAVLHKITHLGLEQGLYQVIYSIIDTIKHYESPAHVQETIAFQNKLEQNFAQGIEADLLIKQAIDFIYQKISQINQEMMNFSRSMVSGNIVGFE